MSTLVLLPTYNERENIPELIGQILALPCGVEILVIDDNSPDGTAQSVEQSFGGEPRVHLLKRPGKLGLGTAYSAGFKFAIQHEYGSVISMDADFSHDPKFIPDLIAALPQFDLVIGSRYVPGGATVNWGILRKIISRTANFVAHLILSMKQADCTSGYRLYRVELLKNLEYESIVADGYSYLVEILFRASRQNSRIGETPIVFVERRHGQSKISRKEVFKAIQTVLRLRFRPQARAKQAVAKA